MQTLKTEEQIKNAALIIVDRIFILRDAVIHLENPKVSDQYRAFLQGLELEIATKFQDFARSK